MLWPLESDGARLHIRNITGATHASQQT